MAGLSPYYASMCSLSHPNPRPYPNPPLPPSLRLFHPAIYATHVSTHRCIYDKGTWSTSTFQRSKRSSSQKGNRAQSSSSYCTVECGKISPLSNHQCSARYVPTSLHTFHITSLSITMSRSLSSSIHLSTLSTPPSIITLFTFSTHLINLLSSSIHRSRYPIP